MQSLSSKNPSSVSASDQAANFEEEDYELQAALQASLMGLVPGTSSDIYNLPPTPLAPPRLARAFAPLPPSDPHTPSDSNSGAQTPTYDLSIPPAEQRADLDPVAASTERNRLMLQRMRQEQEYAQRELWGESAAGPDAALEARRLERQQEQEEEAELLRRAIEESETMARAEGHAQIGGEDEDDDDMDVEAVVPQTVRPNAYPTMGHAVSDRVYDDDDAELQAALKASLEHVPEGWELPELPLHRTPVPPSALFSSAAPPIGNHNIGRELEQDKDDVESAFSDATSTSTTENMALDVPAEVLSVDEIRKRRLARFGA
jgi:Ataxin-3